MLKLFTGDPARILEAAKPAPGEEETSAATVYYLKELSIDDPAKRAIRYRDLEGNSILRVRTAKGAGAAEGGE